MRTTSSNGTASTALTKALTLASSGSIREAERELRWIRSFRLPEGWEESHYGLPTLLAEIYAAFAQQRRETAKALIAGLGRFEMTLDLWPFVYELRARSGYYYGEAGAWQAFAAALEARPDQPVASLYWHQNLWGRVASLAAAMRDREAAERYMARMREMDYPSRRGAVLERAQLSLHLQWREYESVRELAEELLSRTDLNLREETQARVSMAAALHALGDAPGARDHLRLALDLADDSGLLFEALHVARRSIREMTELYAPERTPMLRLLAPMDSPERVPQMTESELRVLQELAHTESRSVIAHRLHLSVNTVKTHLRKIYRKLDVGSRLDAVERAYALGLIQT
ncbi:LuxR C-terminal-related transcriptional regulator [Nesterenkonia pannonica]|uniref:response regulator transcription factor n=1 Tax=Nesterenkonia pannonica TaxID=1548602 RepID=UPI002164ECDF|nr:LuxR C-terminal-related transcriptional regulator [Nesterenkonia pannonica]